LALSNLATATVGCTYVPTSLKYTITVYAITKYDSLVYNQNKFLIHSQDLYF